jgi:N-acetylglucosamine kinase-like BadF-type ATPase
MPDHVAKRVKMPTILHEHLVIGIDGGGTKTLAWLAEREPHAAAQPIGVGLAGPSNPQAVGLDLAGANILQAIRQSFAAAGCEAGPVAAVCLALAGVGREPIRRQMMTWCCHQELAGDVLVTNDAMAVLAAGTPSGWGAALIDGTGSFAFGMTADGSCQRTGGWGYLFGDEGSGYAIGLAALRAVTQAVDGRGPSTILTDRVLEHLSVAGTQRPDSNAVHSTAAAGENCGIGTSCLRRDAAWRSGSQRNCGSNGTRLGWSDPTLDSKAGLAEWSLAAGNGR